MAQALLNNLNIKLDNNGFAFGDTNNKATPVDFGKIFDSKTIAEKTKTITQPTMQPTNKMQTLGDIKLDLNQSEAFKTEYNTAVQESAANSVVDMSAIDAEVAEAEKEAIAEDVEKIIEDEINSTTEEIIDTIITEEDPAMYNELNTLENPTVAIMLHSQIQTTVKNVVSNNEDDTVDDDSVNLTKTNDKNLNNTNLFKQFDNTATKEVSTNLTREDLSLKVDHSKLNKVIDEKVVKDLNVEVVESETNKESFSNDLMQQQTPQEQVAKVMIQGDVKYDKLQFDAIKTVEVKPTEISANKIIEQISKQLDGMYNNSKLNMVLNPGTLGKVNLQIINSKEGLMAQFTVSTQEARDILLKGLNGLKESLLSQGISVDNVSVKLEESNDSENQFDWTEQEGSRGGNKQQGSQKQQKEEEKPFEQMMFELNNNGKV